MKRVFFWIDTRVFGVRFGIKEEKSNYLSLRSLFRLTENALIVALVFALFLQYIDPILYPYFEKIGLYVPEDDAYATLLATISGEIGDGV